MLEELEHTRSFPPPEAGLTRMAAARDRRRRKRRRLIRRLVLVALLLAALGALALVIKTRVFTLDRPLAVKTGAQSADPAQEASAAAEEALPENEPAESAPPENEPAAGTEEILPEAAPEDNAEEIPPEATLEDNAEEAPPEEEAPTPEDPDAPLAPAAVRESTRTLDLELYSEYALLIDLESNTVIAEKNAGETIFPASMTKVMTILTASRYIEDWDETFPMTQSIIDPLFLADASMAGFLHGEEVSMMDLLYGAVLPSGAEATEALAIHVAGSEEAFAGLMNETAQALGLTGTHFVDASGLHDENHYTTLSDMAIIMQAALREPHCREVLTTVNHTSRPTAQNPEGVAMTNRFLYRIQPQQTGNVDIQAAKTGYTAQAMNCCVSFGVMENGRAAICVTAHAWTGDYCIADHLALYGTYCGA